MISGQRLFSKPAIPSYLSTEFPKYSNSSSYWRDHHSKWKTSKQLFLHHTDAGQNPVEKLPALYWCLCPWVKVNIQFNNSAL
jgi:hypothetical protein